MRLATLLLLTCKVTAAVSLPLGAHAVSTVEIDIERITTQAIALDDAVKTYPENRADFDQALNIHVAAQNLDAALHIGIRDAGSLTPLSEVGGQSIIDGITPIATIFLNWLSEIINKEPNITLLPVVAAFIKEDLVELRQDRQSFANALGSVIPDDLKSQVSSLSNTVDPEFVKALAAFS